MSCSYYEQVTDAYLSGEIESPEWRSHLDECPNCTAKLRAESDFDLVIRHAVNEERVQTRQLEAHVRSAIRKSQPWNRPVFVMLRYAVAASVVFGTLAIATFGYAKARVDRSAVCVDAVDDHQEEIVGKAPRKWKSDMRAVEALSQKMTGDPTVAEHVAPTGYHLIGARICVLHGKSYMHLDYSDGNNEISLFVRRQDDDKTLSARVLHFFASRAADAERVDGLTVGSVQKDNLSLVVVSSSPVPEVQKVVELAANRL